MSNIQAIRQENVQYLVQAPAKKEKNFIEGLFWGMIGVEQVVLGTIGVGALLAGTVYAGSRVTENSLQENLLRGVTIVALNVLALQPIRAIFSIAGKSFTHMNDMI